MHLHTQVVLILAQLFLIVHVTDQTKCALTSTYGTVSVSYFATLPSAPDADADLDVEADAGRHRIDLTPLVPTADYSPPQSDYPTYNDDTEDVNSFLKVLSCSDTSLRAVNEEYLRPVNSYKGILLERVPVQSPASDLLALKNENYLEMVRWRDSNVTDQQFALTFARDGRKFSNLMILDLSANLLSTIRRDYFSALSCQYRMLRNTYAVVCIKLKFIAFYHIPCMLLGSSKLSKDIFGDVSIVDNLNVRHGY